MPVFSNTRLVHYSIGGFILFMLLGAGAWYFMSTRISTPETKVNNQAPISTQN
jgi:hypothetical protein